jgi:hypothetical protein
MSAITIELDNETADGLRRLAAAQQRSESEIVREALEAMLRSPRPLPKGMGQYHSGQADNSERARTILRQEANDGTWP